MMEYTVDVRYEGRVAFSRSIRGKILPFGFCSIGFSLCVLYMINIFSAHLHLPSDDACLLLGFGLFFFFGGCFFLPSNAPYAFIIDFGKRTVAFYERGELTVTPLSGYQKVEASPDCGRSLFGKRQGEYKVELVRMNGARFFIRRYKGRARAEHCAESIARVSGLPAFVDKVETVKGKKIGISDINEVLSAKGTLKKEHIGDSVRFSWRSRHSLTSALSVTGVMFGAVIVVIDGILPHRGISLSLFEGDAVVAVFVLSSFFIASFAAAGSYSVMREGARVVLTTRLFGRALRTRALDGVCAAHAMIGGDGNGVILFDRTAKAADHEKEKALPSALFHTGAFSALREKHTLFLDGKALTYGEKLLLERELDGGTGKHSGKTIN